MIGALLGVILTVVAYSIYFERKISAWIQDRVGPNRVGPRGLLQPLADGVKFLLKEDIIPSGADKPIFLLAPCIVFVPAMIAFAVIPWAGKVEVGGATVLAQVASVDVGLLYILAVAGIGVYGAVLGGWASNNKYSFIGGLRSTAMMLSYEIPLGLSLLVVLLVAGELRLERIVDYQIENGWLILSQPIAFMVMLVCVFAENNRLPFDLAESEQELIGGFHTEYSAMKFALFFLGEYAHMITGSALMTALFLGGWHLPFGLSLPGDHSIGAALWRFVIYWIKVSGFLFIFMWVRWTLPRFRFDQLMSLTWRTLVPLTMGLVLVTGAMLYFGLGRWWQLLIANAAVLGFIYKTVLLKPSPRMTGRQSYMPDPNASGQG
jgi:NADH-quinone oxidoreductase subunit H